MSAYFKATNSHQTGEELSFRFAPPLVDLPPNMILHRRQLSRGLVAALAIAASALSARATEITGVVSDAKTKTLLPGASVVIVEDGRTAVTDVQGRFRFLNVNGGNYTLRTTFLGYETKSDAVVVPASGVYPVTVTMGDDVVHLDQFVVEGYREGRAKALQQKRTGQSLTEIVSADSIGNLPDRNVADALSRLPGISVVADNGEGRFVTIRGAEANLNTVTLNGATVAAPGVDGRSGRSMPLDVISSSQISQVEVVKTLTPDMDGSGIGGAINIRSASAFDRPGRFISGSLAVGYSDFANENIYEGDITYADRFGAGGKFGVALSGNYSQRPFRTEAVQSDWRVLSVSGTQAIVPDSIQILPEDAERERIGMNANFEYRPSDDLQLYLRMIYNEFNEENYRQEVVNSQNGNATLLSDHSIRYGSARSERRAFYNPRNQTLFNVSGGGVWRKNNLTVTPELTYSFAQEKQNAGFQTGQFRGGNSSAGPMVLDWHEFLFDFSTTATQYLDPAQYPLRRFSYEYSTVQEDTYTPKVDFKWDLDQFLGGSGFIKVGGKLNSRERYVHDQSVRYIAGSINPTIGSIGAAINPPQSVLGKYNTGFDLNYFRLKEWVAANLSGLTYDADGSAQNNAEDTYDLTEDIWAGYVMGSVKWGKFTLLGGVRYEYSDATISGLEYRNFGGTFQGLYPNVGSFTYDNVLPNLQGRYAFSKNLVGRASYTKTVGRPRYEYMSPKSSLTYLTDTVSPTPGYPYTGSITIGNPDLQAFESDNFDASLEYYLNSGGILSIAGFYKDIANPIYRFSQTEFNTTYNGMNFEQLDSQVYKNADSGKVTGVEFNVQLPFTFLPGFLDGFGVDANYTLVKSEVKVPGRTDELPFFEQPDTSANIALYYQNSKIQARVAWNYQSDSLREIRPVFVANGVTQPGDYYRADRYSIDAQASYKLNDNIRFFINGQNLTNAPQDTYSGAKYRLRYSREFGYNVRGGVQFTF